MLKVIKGDLFTAKGGVIIHGVNCQGVMGSGVAKEIKERFPEAYEAYKKAEKNDELFLGNFSYWTKHTTSYIQETLSIPIQHIVNLCSQKYYGRDSNSVYVDYDAVFHGLQSIVTHFGLYEEYHLPFIGAGLANGDPVKLLNIFSEVFHNCDATLYLK